MCDTAAIVCLYVLLSTFGPRSNKTSSQAHLVPFVTFIAAILFADLGLACMSNLKQIRRSKLSLMLRSAMCDASTVSVYFSDREFPLQRLFAFSQSPSPPFSLAPLFLTIVTFVVLFALLNVAAAASCPDQNRGSVTEDYLATKGLRTASDPSRPPLFLLSVFFATFTTLLSPLGLLIKLSPSRLWVTCWKATLSDGILLKHIISCFP